MRSKWYLLYMVSPFSLECLVTYICLEFRFSLHNRTAQDKPTITIPFSTLQHVINAHEKQQSYLDINSDIKKHLCDEEDIYDWNQEDVAGQIEHLKRPCVEDT